MPNPDLYKDKEQTYVKHFVLENYLERVAWNIFSFDSDFVYVDGFSGPWKSVHESYEDTSFKIAIDKLRRVRKGIKEGQKKDVNFRCLFVEKEKDTYQDLKKTISEISDVSIKPINGSFEDHISEICTFISDSFSLVFIDPTGWTGFPLNKITPLLTKRGEVLINFMSDFIIRFLNDPRPEIAQTFDPLFGEDWFKEWKQLNNEGMSREAAVIQVYTERLKKAGGFRHVTSTRILKPTSERSYFYLIYATNHWKGIQEFRDVEKKAIDAQEKIRNAAKHRVNVKRTGQDNLFGVGIMDLGIKSYEEERNTQASRGYEKLLKILQSNKNGIKYEEILGIVLETPLVWKSDLDEWLGALRGQNKIHIPSMSSRERVPKRGHLIIPKEGL